MSRTRKHPAESNRSGTDGRKAEQNFAACKAVGGRRGTELQFALPRLRVVTFLTISTLTRARA